MGDLADDLDTRLAHIGRPQAGTMVEIREPVGMTPIPDGSVGEIFVQGWQVMDGYSTARRAPRASSPRTASCARATSAL